MTSKQFSEDLTLGQVTDYPDRYDADLLQAIPRSTNRVELGFDDVFRGNDVWYAYEMSWLNPKGKPVVAIGRFEFDASSRNLIESKSFKLYLNSLNQTRFNSREEVRTLLHTELSDRSMGAVKISLFRPDDVQGFAPKVLPGECIDDEDVSISNYELNPGLLKVVPNAQFVRQTLHSHLLKSNCLITNQPDWASVVVDYSGPEMDKEALLRYLISFRLHNEFHEQCVERIFVDLQRYCQPQKLSVQALYTRRGGLDISPFRYCSNSDDRPLGYRTNRQ